MYVMGRPTLNRATTIFNFSKQFIRLVERTKMENIHIERIAVNCKKLASVAYDPATYTLELEFQNSDLFQYFGIPEYIFESLLKSSSKDKFVSLYIKNGGYSYAKM